jgi:hypothetical protein
MEQNAAALDVPGGSGRRARCLARSLDQPGDVGDDELATVDLGNAELRVQRGEGIVRDLRLGRAHRREEGRLAGVGQPDDPGIRDQLEPQADGELLAGLAGLA